MDLQFHDPERRRAAHQRSGLPHRKRGSHNRRAHRRATLVRRGLYPKPPDLRAAEPQKLSDGDIFWVIENGVRLTGMAAFGGASSEHGDTGASWKLVHFIRRLPALTPEEKREMEKYNPK